MFKVGDKCELADWVGKSDLISIGITGGVIAEILANRNNGKIVSIRDNLGWPYEAVFGDNAGNIDWCYPKNYLVSSAKTCMPDTRAYLESITESLAMINEHDIEITHPSTSPTPGQWKVTDNGRIVPVDSKNPELDWIADIQIAPLGPRNVPVICAASVMLDALKQIKRDPAHKRLARPALEALDEALAAGE